MRSNTRMRFLLAVMLLSCLVSLPLPICAAARVATVDVDHIMLHSRAAAEARAHLGEVRKRLGQGLTDLQKAWENAPEKDRAPVLADGAQALNQQMQIEEKAAQGVVNNLLLEVVREWRKANKGTLVFARQNLLDADESLDITPDVLKVMDTRKVTFPKLPEIAIRRPGDTSAPQQAGKGAGGKTGPAVRAPVQQRQQRPPARQ